MDVKQIIGCFSRSRTIYLRNRESEIIQIFLRSEEMILHITGSPGTGKTATVQKALEDTKYVYVNYFLEPEIEKILGKTKTGVAVIDEFDKYLEERRSWCLKMLLRLREKEMKVITISNGLKMGNLRFKPYTAKDLSDILDLKMKEIGCEIMSKETVNFLAKRHERNGDIREMFKMICSVIGKKNEPFLEIRDFLQTERRIDGGIQYEMVGRIKNNELNRKRAYGMYLIECEGMAIPPITKTEFNMIFDMS